MNDEFYNKHYIMTRLDGAITDIWSDGPHPEKDTLDAICINDWGGYQFRFTPNGEENPPICDMDGIPLYKWNGKSVVSRTEEEIAAERVAILNSPERRTAELKRQLTELDRQAIRPLRAIEAGTSTDEDTDKLAELEAEAERLRDELARLEGGE